ncbi:erythromycin esterase family protein [Streptomyces sp. NPDC058671]|uniref:erythromycin esterase family protein n=1 Tax=Streptomyces sp. NPDC058671 TaxID=3346590 RepID=UPI003665B80F
MSHARPVSRRRLLSLAAATVVSSGSLGAGTAAAGSSSAAEPVDALNRGARPLSDLKALGRMVGDAHVVGLGEASHSAHEFFTLKHRVFRHLVATKGFTTFALEASWSTGLRLDAYVTRGIGDPVQIMRDEFQGQYTLWNTKEYLDLILWMHRYNLTHPDRPQLRFVGNDLGYAGPDAFDHVTDDLATHRPDLAERISDLYAGLKPATGTQAGPWMLAQLTKELPARRAEADRADAALALLRNHGRPHTIDRDTDRAHAWALQNATAIAQSYTAYAFPDEQFPERMRYRDRAMAANTAWWLQHKDGRILLASNNSHVAYTSDNPDEFPEPTGAFLRTQLGPDYVNIGLTFNQGTVNALPDFTAQPQEYTVTPAPQGHNEHTLDKLCHRDFTIDLRTAPPAARTWLAAARPTRSYGLYWSTDDPATALGHSYDILIHLHQVEAAHLLR